MGQGAGCRFMHRLSWPLLAITSSVGAFVIDLLVGYIIYATLKRIATVEDDYQEMMELKKRAEAADITKSQALATVSHEIRTPMDVVLGHAGNDGLHGYMLSVGHCLHARVIFFMNS